MANYCDYEVRVRGSKKICHMVYASMPCLDFKNLDWETADGNAYLVSFTGNCKWSVNFGVKDALNKINIASMSEAEIEEKGVDYWEYSLRAKSEALQCEIMAHYWSEESGFDQFDHYKNGAVLKKRKIQFNYEKQTEFDWDRLEFVGHEGEYDESVDGEQQDANFMATLLGLGGSLADHSSETDDEDQNALNEINEMLDKLSHAVEDLAAEAGIDLHDSSIGNTGYDLYRWTFTEGKRASVAGWSIAVPDGFKLVPKSHRSKAPKLGSDEAPTRDFEAVPVNHADAAGDASVHLMSGTNQKGNTADKDSSFCHPEARAGLSVALAEGLYAKSASLMGPLAGALGNAFNFVDFFGAGWDDLHGYVVVQDTTGDSYSFVATIRTEDNETQTLRVQTQSITRQQRADLSESIIAWIKTFRFDRAVKKPCAPIIDNPDCLKNLEKDDVSLFKKAVEQADADYKAAFVGQSKRLDYQASQGSLDDYSAEQARQILQNSISVKEYYFKKIDGVMESALSAGISAATLQKMYQALEPLYVCVTSMTIDDQEVQIETPEAIERVSEKWKRGAASVKKAAQAEKRAAEEAKKRAEEERKRKAEQKRIAREQEEKEYRAAYAQWLEDKKKAEESRKVAIAEKLEEDRKAYRAKLAEAYEKERAVLQQEVDALTERTAGVEQRLRELGAFKFSEKSVLRKQLAQFAEEKKSLAAKLDAAKQDYAAKMERVEKSVPDIGSTARKEIYTRIPIPTVPGKPNRS